METNYKLLRNATLIDKYGLSHKQQTLVIDGNLIAWKGDDDKLPMSLQNWRRTSKIVSKN